MSAADRLLCIDLQIDPRRGLQPDANAIFGARALLSVARRSGWTVAHTRMRTRPGGSSGFGETRISGMRPLMSERVFLRSSRSIADCPGLLDLLDDWKNETVYVAAFDHVTLLSCLLLRYESGPRMVLVENALSAGTSVATREALESFRNAANHLAAGSTTIHKILSRSEVRISPLHQQSA